MMNFKLNKKSISNIVFVIAILVLLYPPSREWFMRQIAFSPSVETKQDSKKLSTYNWELKGLNTTSINFQEFENKVVFVNFWATWCPPCRAEMPMIQKLYNDYKDKIEFVFLTNEDWETVDLFFKKNNYQLPVYNSLSTPPNAFLETNSIPATYLIDKQRNIRISKVGAADWNSTKIRKLLDELILE
ncbi:TlpA disulfide reductase family protein [uncultured Lutibacter sp.]|uniref:TlpA family protein disulfide reductase n=1 Tax=uncultured Lutibacter sp. TaxID=437739 RepID=UPI002610EC19|nr:TlpA disulfide reductase family protein [uncultured Lutibacter sp.]